MTYSIAIERGDLNYSELEPNYRLHYAEMQARLAADGFETSPYRPRLDVYFDRFRSGGLINYVARHDGKPVGHANIYLTNDMHNGDLIAQEDTLYVLPGHRNGLGRKLVRFVLDDLGSRGVKRAYVTPVTDLRVGKIWKRMGFQDVASVMVWQFKGQ